MTAIVRLYTGAFGHLDRLCEGWLIGTLARFIFAATLLVFFWRSALTKIGDGFAGIFELRAGAYAQILPKQMEAVGYDPSQLGLFAHIVVHAGTYGEFVLPFLIVAGLFTRLAALGMIGFIAVMTYTDITQHGADPGTIGAWFDGDPGALIADQRLYWAFAMLVLALKGPGPLSLDRLLGRGRL